SHQRLEHAAEQQRKREFPEFVDAAEHACRGDVQQQQQGGGPGRDARVKEAFEHQTASTSDAYRSINALISNCSTALRRAASPSRVRSAVSASSVSIARASDSGDRGKCSSALIPSRQKSPRPPTPDDTTGSPLAMASIAVLPSASKCDGCTRRSAAR